MRIGHGFDVHRLVPNRKLILGGVEIRHDRGLDGHSDADVLCHAIIDAILGAAALGDIGTHFPSSDERWQDAGSIDLLRKAERKAYAAGFRVRQLDSTVVAHEPRLTGHVEGMRRNAAAALGLDINVVSVKATTTDGLGLTGRGEGIAAFAVVLLE
jgi:2-C-methyl-D-erythritol 2,4-cyclodiphosphate synthase